MDIVGLICVGIFCFIEPKINKVDVSKNKLIKRFIITIYNICCIFLIPFIKSFIDISDFWLEITYSSIGYHIFSCLFQIYSLYIKQPSVELVEPTAEPTAETRPEIPKEVTEEIKEEDALRV